MAAVKYLDENGLSTVWSKVKGIVTPKADKVSGATAGHLAGLNASGNLTDSGLAATNVAQKDGSYSGMTVGAAEDLVSAESVASEFTSRITGGSTAVGKGGTALVDKIKGRTLVWNQLAKSSQSAWAPGMTGSSMSFLDGAIRITSNSDNISNMCAAQYINTISGHKYYMRYEVMSHNLTGLYYAGYLVSPTQWLGDVTISEVDKKVAFSNIVEANNDRTRVMFGLYRHGTGAYFSTGDYVDYSNIMLIDLTLMFGVGNEPSTAADFEALYPGPYYAYNPGILINNGKQSEYNLVFNQKITPQVFTMATGSIISSFSASADGSYAITLASAAPDGVNTGTSVANFFTAGHKYYLKNNSSNLDYLVLRSPAIGDFNEQQQILALASDWDGGSNNNIRIRFKPNTPAGDYTIRPWVVDLTAMFGAGNEPTTPEEFEAMFPADYYPYDTGTEQHFSFPQFKTKIETVGWNIWDEEWEPGTINASTGLPSGSAGIRSKNFCKILPSTAYYRQAGGGGAKYTMFYDASQNFIGWSADSSFQTPSDARYFKISCTQSYGSIYANDICLSLSDTSRNGTYEPYWRSELELGLGDIKVKSHNLWDEVWEAGSISTNTGEDAASDTYIRTKNYVPILGSTYVFSGVSVFPRYYDENYQYLSNGTSVRSGLISPPAGTAYARFVITGSTYDDSNKTCISLSDPAFNGRYEPYGDGGVITLTGGLKSAGTVYDEISEGKLVKRLESVDMGSLTWAYQQDYTRFYTSGVKEVAKPTVNSDTIGNILTPRYQTTTARLTTLNDKTISISDTGNVQSKDTAYTDASLFKASLAGVILYYELARPIEYELADAIPTAMRNDPYGTERRLPEDALGLVTAPFRADITYSTNIKEAVQSLPQNYINVNSMQDFLAALGAQMGGTWTMRPADGKFDFTFTPNPSNE